MHVGKRRPRPQSCLLRHDHREEIINHRSCTRARRREISNTNSRKFSTLASFIAIILVSLYNPNLPTSAQESNNFFCGESWGDASNNCDERQHCPTGTDDECEVAGHICFGGTTCDSKLGHGNKFKYANLPYEDISNTRFCGNGWNNAIDSCSIETHCPSGYSDECPKGDSCYGGLSCNVQDMIAKEEEASGGADAANKIGKHDSARSNFCGTSWGDASSKCNKWCPDGEDTSCPGGQTCFGNTECYHSEDLVPTQTPILITMAPVTGAPVARNDPGNTRFCGITWGIANAECSVETSCPSGSSDDCPEGQSCHGGTSCNLYEMIEKANTPVIPTPSPTMPPVTRDDQSNRRFCGTSWSSAQENCSLATHCPDDNCPSGQICYGGISTCNAYDLTGSPTKQPTPKPTWSPTLRPTAPTNSPTLSPTNKTGTPTLTVTFPPTGSSSPTAPPVIPEDDPRHSYWCGKDWQDVTSKCQDPCPSGEDTDCPNKLSCFAFTPCRPEPKKTPKPSSEPTSSPKPTELPVTLPPTTVEPTRAKQTTMSPTGKPTLPITEEPSQSPIYVTTTLLPVSPPSFRPTSSPTSISYSTVTAQPTTLLIGSVVATDRPTSISAADLQNISPKTALPTNKPTNKPTAVSITDPIPAADIPAPRAEIIAKVGSILMKSKSEMVNNILLSLDTVSGIESPTQLYQYEGFLGGLGVYTKGHMGQSYFYLGPPDDLSAATNYGLVNVALFLSQAAIETVMHDVCDEISWEKDVFGMYPLSNACGQGKFTGTSNVPYEDANQCKEEEAFMACTVSPGMKATAETKGGWAGSPPPFECFPNPAGLLSTGAWNPFLSCADDGCNYYDGQVRGGIDPTSIPSSNSFGRSDVEGCCWWGRGAFPRESAGTCQIGKLNYYLGKRAADEGRSSARYSIDFCKDPSAICRQDSSDIIANAEIRWLMGLQYWVDNIQTYNKDGWSYIDKLHDFVNKGLADMDFFDDVSRIVTRGCHNKSKCGNPISSSERRAVFNKIILTFAKAQTGKLDEVATAPSPTNSPLKLSTSMPTKGPAKEPTLQPSSRADSKPSSSVFLMTDSPVSMAPVTADPTTSPLTAIDNPGLTAEELAERFNVANNYCASSLDDARADCATSKIKTCNAADPPCAIGTACFGNVVCLIPGSHDVTGTTNTAFGPPENSASCDGVCLVPLLADECPIGDAASAYLPDCLSIAVGGVCEGAGDCGTNVELNNCGDRDIYTRVFLEKCSSKTDSISSVENNETMQLISTAPSSSEPPSAAVINVAYPNGTMPNNNSGADVGPEEFDEQQGYFDNSTPENVELRGIGTWWRDVPLRSGSDKFRVTFLISVVNAITLLLFTVA